MALPTRNFDQMVSDQQAALQVAQPLFTFSPGSVVQALAEANSGLALFLQYQTYEVLEAARLATCEADDCDTFGADFLFSRYPAVASTGQVLFQRFTAPNKLLVPIGTLVKTSDNRVTFQVVEDTSNPAFDAGLQAYVMNPGVLQVAALVRSVVPGSIGNVSVGAITKIASSLAVAKVTNPAQFINGIDQESDAAFKSRFQLYINSRYAATPLAIANAIVNTDPAVSYTIQENKAADGSALPGSVLIYVDDGTGEPPPELILALQSNVEQVRPAAVSFSLEPAHVVAISIQMATIFKTGYNRNDFVGTIATAVENYINGLSVGASLYLTRLYQVIYDSANNALQDVYNLTINGTNDDLIIGLDQVCRFVTSLPIGSQLITSEMTID